MGESCGAGTGWIFAADVEGSQCKSPSTGRGLYKEPVRTNSSTQNLPSIAISILNVDVDWRPTAHPFVNVCHTVCHRSRGRDSRRCTGPLDMFWASAPQSDRILLMRFCTPLGHVFGLDRNGSPPEFFDLCRSFICQDILRRHATVLLCHEPDIGPLTCL